MATFIETERQRQAYFLSRRLQQRRRDLAGLLLVINLVVILFVAIGIYLLSGT